MSLLRTQFASLRVAASSASIAGRRTLLTTAVRRTDDPRVLNKDTHSGASVKADKHSKDPKTLQKETAESANQGSSSSGAKDRPTHSEDAVHGEKHGKSPEQLQKETANKT
ncbi:hypothetical protein PSEUBRA_003351 [Kalmanozyma brasiliensis GHG001]|uniref:Uncharacterized protein n=1 Tax=Kalmanozyma brasiliensis (strain GHG001) TaxID=1365824 RepID=V5EA01_KALBG|nr:uncharacterized protein PSEUBRA_003351 [Kalmanozyma brasiliensis GHG001]EST07186.1 hypothetical protein PSEUBRA_003351 [Kalmanozyma brasiliensis GHG001]